MKALVIGSTGFTGTLLLRLLSNHEKITSLTAVSSSQQGKNIDDSFILTHNAEKLTHKNYVGIDELTDDYEVVFSALPHGVSAEMYQRISKLFKSGTPSSQKNQELTTLPPEHPLENTSNQHNIPFVYIDLSADFRFKSIDSYLETYPESHVQKSAFFHRAYHNAVYGLSELQRDKIEQANIIACPGCYPTSILIPLIPILQYVSPTGTISIASISGISGAGVTPSPTNIFCNRTESVAPYKPGRTHRHHAEIKHQLQHIAFSEASFTFSPHLAPLSQGMLSTIHIPLHSDDIGRAKTALISQYIDEHFVKVHDNHISAIDTQKVRNTNAIHINLHEEEDMLIIFSCLDNLWKGAASQAIQNFNIRFGFDETTGLQYF